MTAAKMIMPKTRSRLDTSFQNFSQNFMIYNLPLHGTLLFSYHI